MLHNRYQIRGGEDESTEAEVSLLRSAGHEVKFMEASNDHILSSSEKIKAALSTVWSQRWHSIVSHALTEDKYDILHVQNFFPLISPAVYYAAHARGVRVVQAVRNYRIACPAYTLFRDGRLCRDCVGTTFKIPGVRHRCYRNSLVGTGALAAMSSVHHLAGTWKTRVDRFIAISDYVAEVLRADGLPGDKISVKPNFVALDNSKPVVPMSERGYLLYVGRISAEKGIDILLDAYAKLETAPPLYVVGAGDIPSGLPEGVKVLGKKPLAEVYDLMSRAIGVIMPGSWPEPFGRVAIEAFAFGTPVIASDIGGVAEIILSGQNGYSFTPSDAGDLADRIRMLLSSPDTQSELSEGAYRSYQEKYTPGENLGMLEEIYASVLSRGRSPL